MSLVAPCLNEERNVSELAGRFFAESTRRGRTVEIIFVDDGSTDNTLEEISTLSKEYGDRVQIVIHENNRGIAASWLSGTEAARGEMICLIDSDLQNPPESALDLLDALEKSGADFAQGIRVPTRNQQRRRIVMSRLLNIVLNKSFGMQARDNKSGFIVTRRTNLLRLLTNQSGYRHFQTFIGVAAHSNGLSFVEIETPFEDRRSGVSFLSGRTIQVIAEVLVDIRRARREF